MEDPVYLNVYKSESFLIIIGLLRWHFVGESWIWTQAIPRTWSNNVAQFAKRTPQGQLKTAVIFFENDKKNLLLI